MALKYEVPNLDSVPENLRSLYVARDGKFFLDVEGVASARDLADANGKIVTFRDTNIALLKALGVESPEAGLQRAGLIAGLTSERLAELKDLDPVAAKAALARVKELEAKGLKTDTDMAAQMKAALDAALGPVREELAAEKKARAEAQSRADDALLRQTIGDKYLKAGGKAEMIDFIIFEAQKAFRVIDNAVKALDNRFSADKPGQPLGVDEWLASATKSFAPAFDASKGGGAAPGNGGAGAHQPGTKVIRGTMKDMQDVSGLDIDPKTGRLVDASGTPVAYEVGQT